MISSSFLSNDGNCNLTYRTFSIAHSPDQSIRASEKITVALYLHILYTPQSKQCFKSSKVLPLILRTKFREAVNHILPKTIYNIRSIEDRRQYRTSSLHVGVYRAHNLWRHLNTLKEFLLIILSNILVYIFYYHYHSTISQADPSEIKTNSAALAKVQTTGFEGKSRKN